MEIQILLILIHPLPCAKFESDLSRANTLVGNGDFRVSNLVSM